MEDDKDSGFVMFDASAISVLESIFNCSDEPVAKTASVKFMITMQDEKNLSCLGYSQSEIDNLTPQEAEDIIKAG